MRKQVLHYLYNIEYINPSVDRSVTGPERSQGRLPQTCHYSRSLLKMRLFLKLFLLSRVTHNPQVSTVYDYQVTFCLNKYIVLNDDCWRLPPTPSVPELFLRNTPMVSSHACLGSGLSGFFSSTPLAYSAMVDFCDFVDLLSQASTSCLPLSPNPPAHTHTHQRENTTAHFRQTFLCKFPKGKLALMNLEDKATFVEGHSQMQLLFQSLNIYSSLLGQLLDQLLKFYVAKGSSPHSHEHCQQVVAFVSRTS